MKYKDEDTLSSDILILIPQGYSKHISMDQRIKKNIKTNSFHQQSTKIITNSEKTCATLMFWKTQVE